MSVVFEAQKRETVGTGSARELRRQGFVPAVVYGGKGEAIEVALPSKELELEANKFGFGSKKITIKLGSKKEEVLAREWQLHPVSDRVMHVDFQRVAKGDKMRVDVPVKFSGRDVSPGIKRGGTLNVVRFAIECYCDVDSIPPFIEVDLSESVIGQSIHKRHVNIPEGIDTVAKHDFTICAIVGRGAKKAESEDGEEGEASAEGGEE